MILPSSRRRISKSLPTEAALPWWLPTGLCVVAAGAIYGFVATSEGETWGATATALATVLLVAYTARLYTTALAQLRASTRPLLVEVKPYAPPPPDLGARIDPKTNRPLYHIDFPDGSKMKWDGRRIFVHQQAPEPFRVSLILRNVGSGIALISDELTVSTIDDDVSLPIAGQHIRYPRLPPGESTRINLVLAPWQAPEKVPFFVSVTYADFSQQFLERAIIEVAPEVTRAWTRDPADDRSWGVRNIRYTRP